MVQSRLIYMFETFPGTTIRRLLPDLGKNPAYNPCRLLEDAPVHVSQNTSPDNMATEYCALFSYPLSGSTLLRLLNCVSDPTQVELKRKPILDDWEPMLNPGRANSRFKLDYFRNLLKFHTQKPNPESGQQADENMAWAWAIFYQDHLERYIAALKEEVAETFSLPPFFEFTAFPKANIPAEIIETFVNQFGKKKVKYFFDQNPKLQTAFAQYILKLTRDKKVLSAPNNRIQISRFTHLIEEEQLQSFLRDFRSWLYIQGSADAFDQALLAFNHFQEVLTESGTYLVKGLSKQLQAGGLSPEVTIRRKEQEVKYVLSAADGMHSFTYAMIQESTHYNPVPNRALLPILRWKTHPDGKREFITNQPDRSFTDSLQLPVPDQYVQTPLWDTVAGVLIAGLCAPDVLAGWGPYVYLRGLRNSRGPAQMPVEILRRREEVITPLPTALEEYTKRDKHLFSM